MAVYEPITLTLGDKTYSIKKVTGRAMREMSPIDDIYERATLDKPVGAADMDIAAEWVCLLFNNQFTPSDFIDQYPVDVWWKDVFIFYYAIKDGLTHKLTEFPTQPETPESPKE